MILLKFGDQAIRGYTNVAPGGVVRYGGALRAAVPAEDGGLGHRR